MDWGETNSSKLWMSWTDPSFLVQTKRISRANLVNDHPKRGAAKAPMEGESLASLSN